jgi:hypothetical protein
MTDDPLTPSLEMSCVHRFRFWHLFNDNGRPLVLYRRRHTKKHADGSVTNELDVEWGNLESSFFTGDTRQQFIDAWDQLLDWYGAQQ